jgi:UDP:flavonoid glycosyltransferase YjiC (YdhE family)
VLYCGFGSAALSAGLGPAAAAACGAGGRAAGFRVLLAAGLGGGLPRPHDAASDEEDTSDADADVFWVREAPHAWLLRRCAVALHHAGAGTCAAALRAGVPQICAPLEFDQPFWARRMRALGVAHEPLSVQTLSCDAVAAAVRRAAGEGTRARAAAMADALASEPDGAAVAALFVREYLASSDAKKAAEKEAARAEAHAAASGAEGLAAAAAAALPAQSSACALRQQQQQAGGGGTAARTVMAAGGC